MKKGVGSIGKKDKVYSVGATWRERGYNERATYAIVDEKDNIYLRYGRRQTFRTKGAALFAMIEIMRKNWEKLKVVKLK